MRIERELMRGAGPVAVLHLLAEREMYGYELAVELGARSGGVLEMGHSTLYPLLYNLEAKGWITPKWREADSGRDRKYYRLTTEGRRVLAVRREQWQALGAAMRRLGVLAPEAKR
jgi:PadR family transcriptional regulator PadR